MTAQTISADAVRSRVKLFWDLFAGKSGDALSDLYAYEATVFSPIGDRSEPGRVAVVRRTRQYFQPQVRIETHIGPVEVRVVGERLALATYTFSFSAEHLANDFQRESRLAFKNGRATQMFRLEPDGELRILHEHMSTPIAPA